MLKGCIASLDVLRVKRIIEVYYILDLIFLAFASVSTGYNHIFLMKIISDMWEHREIPTMKFSSVEKNDFNKATI